MKIKNLLLPLGVTLSAHLLALALQAQQPGGLPAKFSAEIKRDVAEFVQGQADANSIANLQNNIVGIIQRTGTDTRILSQIVSDAVNEAAQVHGSTIKKIANVIRISTQSAVSGALSSDTSNPSKAIEDIARTVSFQYLSLTAKGDFDPEKKHVALVTLAMSSGVTLAVLDHDAANSVSLLGNLASGTLNGSLTASYNHNFDSTQTTSFAAQGLILGMMQATTAKKINANEICTSISQLAYTSTINNTSLQKPEHVAFNGQAAIRGLLDGVFHANVKAQVGSKSLAALASSSYQGITESLAGGYKADVNTTELREAAFDTWSTKMYELIPDSDNQLQVEIVTSLFDNSEGNPQRLAVISQEICKILQINEKSQRALELVPVMSKCAINSILPVESLSFKNISPFVSSCTEKVTSALPESAVKVTYSSLFSGAIDAVKASNRDLVAHTQLLAQVISNCTIKSSKSLNRDTSKFVELAVEGVVDSTVEASLADGLKVTEPAVLIEAGVEGITVGLILGLAEEPVDSAAKVITLASRTAAGSAIRAGKNRQLTTERVIDFALKCTRGCTSGIVKVSEGKESLNTASARLLEPAAYGAAMGIMSSTISQGTDALVSQKEIVDFATATSFGSTSGAVFNGSKANAPDYAENAANGAVLGITSIAAHLFSKPENLETLKEVTFAACKGAAMGAISAGADTSKDLKPIARRASYGGTSAATVAVISSSPSQEVLSEISKMAARGTAQGTMEAAFRTLVGGTQTGGSESSE